MSLALFLKKIPSLFQYRQSSLIRNTFSWISVISSGRPSMKLFYLYLVTTPNYNEEVLTSTCNKYAPISLFLETLFQNNLDMALIYLFINGRMDYKKLVWIYTMEYYLTCYWQENRWKQISSWQTTSQTQTAILFFLLYGESKFQKRGMSG